MKFRAFIAGVRGTSALEFALIAPALVVIPVPLVDIGLGFYQQMEVAQAAQAGAEYTLKHAYNAASVLAAATASTPLSVAISSQQSCGCPSGASVTFITGTPGGCGTCASGATAGTYTQVTSSATYTPPIAFSPMIKSAYALTSTATVRTQ